MSVPFKPGPFEPVSLYDAPWLAVTQALEGTMTWESLKATLIGQGHRLTPQQRESYVKRLKDSVGGGSVADAAIDIATNPFVLAAFVFSPAGASALSRAGREGGRVFGEFLKKTNVPWIAKTIHQVTDGTAAAQALNEAMADQAHLLREFGEGSAEKGLPSIAKLEERLAERMGVKLRHWMRPEKIRDEALRERVIKVQEAIEGELSGKARRVTYEDPSWIPEMREWREGKWVPLEDEGRRRRLWNQWQDDRRKGLRLPTSSAPGGPVPSPAVREGMEVELISSGRNHVYAELPSSRFEMESWVQDPLAFRRVLEQEGALELTEGLREHMLERFRLLYAKDSITRDQLKTATREQLAGMVDHDKILRQWVNQSDNDLVGRDFSGHDDFVSMLLSRSTRAQILRGARERQATLQRTLGRDATPEQVKFFLEQEYGKVKDAVVRGFVATVDTGAYMPRNMSEWSDMGTDGALRALRPGEVTVGRDGNPMIRTATAGSNRSRPRESRVPVYHPDDLAAWGRRWGTDGRGYQQARDEADRAVQGLVQGDGPQAFQRLRFTESLKRYERQTARDYAMTGAPVSEEILAIQRRLVPQWKQLEQEGQLPMLRSDRTTTPLEGTTRTTEFQRANPETGEAETALRVTVPDRPHPGELDPLRSFEADDAFRPPGGWTRADVVRQAELLLNRFSPTSSTGRGPGQLLREVGVPTVLGMNHHHFGITEAMVKLTQHMARGVVNAPAMKQVLPQGMIRYLEDFSDPERAASLAPEWAHNAAGWIYSSTLGVNLASVLLNVTQPMMHLGITMGMRNVIPAYADAMGDLGRYFSKRLELYGPRVQLTQAERRRVADAANIQFWEETGLSGNLLEDLDRLAFQEGYRKGGSKFRFLAQELPLKPFEKGEWLNRLVAAHTMKRIYQKNGRITKRGNLFEGVTPRDMDDLRSDITRAVQETQFGADPLNTPLMFMGAAGGVLRNPLVRQFSTFTIRTPLAFLELGSKLNQGARSTVFGRNAGWFFGDTIRALGISAVLYEGYKNFGMDPQGVGFVPAVTDIFGGEDILNRDSGIPLFTPPALDISLDLLRGAFGEERQLLADAAARLFPGGVALQRALGAAPNLQGAALGLGNIPAMLQRQYADWENPTPDGRVAVFKGDGTLVDYQRPADLVLRSLGAPVASTRDAQKFDRFLQTQRDKIVAYRRDILNAYMANNVGKAVRLKQRYEREFGIPFTVTERQVKDRIKSTLVPRSSRMLDRMPIDSRPQYLELARQQAARLGVPAEVFTGDASTSGARRSGTPTDIEQARREGELLQKVRQLLATKEQQRQISSGEWSPYSGYLTPGPPG